MSAKVNLAFWRDVVRALKDARWAIADELSAAGPEEVDEHPTLRDHGRSMERADKVLARTKEELRALRRAVGVAVKEERQRTREVLRQELAAVIALEPSEQGGEWTGGAKALARRLRDRLGRRMLREAVS